MKNELLLSAALLPLCGMAGEVHTRPSNETAPVTDKRPNIILFLVDDMGWQDTSLPFWTQRTRYNDTYHTPNMERLAKQGKRVLLIDADAQGSLTASLGFTEPDKLEETLATVMANIINDVEMEDDYGILRHEEGIDLMPGNIELSGLEVSLVNVMSRELVMRSYIE